MMLADPLSSYAAYYEQGRDDAFDSSRRHGPVQGMAIVATRKSPIAL